MARVDQVEVKLACGARVILTVRVERRGCQLGGAECPTAADVAGALWLAVQDYEARAPRAE